MSGQSNEVTRWYLRTLLTGSVSVVGPCGNFGTHKLHVHAISCLMLPLESLEVLSDNVSLWRARGTSLRPRIMLLSTVNPIGQGITHLVYLTSWILKLYAHAYIPPISMHIWFMHVCSCPSHKPPMIHYHAPCPCHVATLLHARHLALPHHTCHGSMRCIIDWRMMDFPTLQPWRV